MTVRMTVALALAGLAWMGIADAGDARRMGYPDFVRQWPQLKGVMLGASGEKEFRDLRDMGATLVRYQMVADWKSFRDAAKDKGTDETAEYESWLKERLDHLEEMLPWGRKYGIRICVDQHVHLGGLTHEKHSSDMIFAERKYEDLLVATWEKIARRFKGNWDVLYGYDLFNEPITRENELTKRSWHDVFCRVIEAVRAIDPESVIVVEPNCHASPRGFDVRNPYGLKGVDLLPYDNLIYSVHVYIPMGYSHQGLFQKKEDYKPVPYPAANAIADPNRKRYPGDMGEDTGKAELWDKQYVREAIQSVRDFQLRHGVRIFVGEFSAAAYAPGAEKYIGDLCDLFREYGWDWTYHAFRESACWSFEHEGPSFYELKKAGRKTRRQEVLEQYMGDANMPVRRGGVEGRPYWNAHSIMFLYPPAFEFKRVEGAAKYRFDVTDDIHEKLSFMADSPEADLSPVWLKLPTGYVTVVVTGVDATGKDLGVAGRRTFWRKAPFKEGTYPKAKYGYAECAGMIFENLRTRETSRHLDRTGRLLQIQENRYPTKMLNGLIRSMVQYAEISAERRSEALSLAKKAADCLLAFSEKPTARYPFFPPTYNPEKYEANFEWERRRKCMTIYPAYAASAYLSLYEAVGDEKYLKAATAIGETYLAFQGDDGTWPLTIDFDEGPYGVNRLMPLDVAQLFDRLFRKTGDGRFRAAGDKAFAYIERNLVESWNWEGQFEDTPLTDHYKNLTKHPACSTAIYLLERYPGDREKLALARELLRFAEDQFVNWERPYDTGRRVPDKRKFTGFYDRFWDQDQWIMPSVMEQYGCYAPVDASAAKLVRTYLALYRAEKRPDDLAKARALADTATRCTSSDGLESTWWSENMLDKEIWPNCMGAMAAALSELAAAVPDGVAGSTAALPIQRTMKTLEESTFENPATVRVLFYGQSIVEQGWHVRVMADLRKRYPSVRFEVANRAIGGFQSPWLIETAESDLYPFYPDLLFFRVYGPLDKYEEIVRKVRETTTAEIVLWTDHLSRRECETREMVEGLRGAKDERSDAIRGIAAKYRCMCVDLRKKWIDRMLAENVSVTNLLKDSVHLLEDGPAFGWYADFLSEELVRVPGASGEPEISGRITKVPLTDKAVTRHRDGRMTLAFSGNRVVAVANGRGGCAVRVTLDGKDPSEFPEMHCNTRPSRIASHWMPAIRHVSSDPSVKPVVQDWTYTFLEGTEPMTPIHFRVDGSVTGFEGEGWSTNEFRSASGRVIIPRGQPDRWQYEYFVRDNKCGDWKYAKPGQTLRWATRPLYADPYEPQAEGTRTTLVQNCTNGPHELELSVGSGDCGIAYFLVYEPATRK